MPKFLEISSLILTVILAIVVLKNPDYENKTLMMVVLVLLFIFSLLNLLT